MTETVCLFIGEVTSFNVRQTTKNISRMLSDSYTVDILSVQPEYFDSDFETSITLYGGEYPSSLLGAGHALDSYLKTHDPVVIIQITHPPAHGTVVGTLARRHDVPFVYRYAGDRFVSYQVSRRFQKILRYGWNNILGRLPLRLSHAGIAMGPVGWNRLVDRGMDPQSTTILPPPIDSERFSKSGETAELPVPEDRSIAMFVGRFMYLKGSKTLERTIPLILERRQDLQFVILGDKRDDIVLPSSYREHVTFVPPVDPSEMPKYFRRADLVIHPSLTEGLPRVILESLLTRTPVIARNIGDIKYATTNTFETKDDFVDMVCGFESLPVDAADRFSLDALKSKYERFVADCIAGGM